MRHIANVWIIPQIRSIHVEKLLILVHPDASHTNSVNSMCVFVVRKTVRMELAEDVTDARAWNGFESASALPDAEAL